MLSNRLIITALDFKADRGWARQVSSSDGNLISGPIGFTISGVAQVFLGEDDSDWGICIPDQATKNRVPVIGELIVGSIARNCGGSRALDPNGNPFLRNWVYADQHDTIRGLVNSPADRLETTEETDDPYAGDEGDYVSTSQVYGRAYALFESAEMAREVADMYPGDFI